MSGFAKRLWTAARIGWAVESNWTRTSLFILYSAVRPLALCLLLYFLFRIVYSDPASQQAFVGVYVANAFFTMVVALTSGVTWIVINDREHYYITRYIYVAPMRYLWYITGRCLPLLLLAISSLLIVIVFGRYALGMDIGFGAVRWGLLVPSLLLGLLSTAALGIFFAGFCLVTAKHSILLAEGAGSVFLLLCGVIFPVDILPAPLKVAGMGLPITYWMEATRRTFGVTGFSPVLAPFSNLQLLLVLLVSTVLLLGATYWAFHAFENLAKKYGKIDQATNY